MNHKRNRPKHQRAGCLLCKPHKDEREGRASAQPVAVRRVVQADKPTFSCYCPPCVLGNYAQCWASFWDDAEKWCDDPGCLDCNPDPYEPMPPLTAMVAELAR